MEEEEGRSEWLPDIATWDMILEIVKWRLGVPLLNIAMFLAPQLEFKRKIIADLTTK